MARRPLLLLLGVVLAMLASACGDEPTIASERTGSQVGADSGTPADELASTASAAGDSDGGDSDAGDSDVTASTAITAGPAPEGPDDLARFMQLRVDDFTAGHELSSDLDHDDICHEVPGVTVAFPPLAETSTQIEKDHTHFANVAVYDSPAEAIEAFEYLESSYEYCSGGWTEDRNGNEILIETEQFAAPSVAGTDRLTGFAILLSIESAGFLFESNLMVIGPVLVSTGSTDIDVVTELAEVIVARYGGDSAAAAIDPSDYFEPLPGYGSPEYYSWVDGPLAIRDAKFMSDGANAWIRGSTDRRIDELASNACVTTQHLTVGDDLFSVESTILELFTEFEQGKYLPETLGEIYGLAVATYCPGLVGHLEEVIERAAPGEFTESA